MTKINNFNVYPSTNSLPFLNWQKLALFHKLITLPNLTKMAFAVTFRASFQFHYFQFHWNTISFPFCPFWFQLTHHIIPISFFSIYNIFNIKKLNRESIDNLDYGLLTERTQFPILEFPRGNTKKWVKIFATICMRYHKIEDPSVIWIAKKENPMLKY